LKLFNEGLLRSFNESDGLDYIALRYFNVYGPRMDIHGAYTEVLVRWMERIEAGQAPLIFGDGLQTMDFVFVEDVAQANLLAARSPVSDAVFNVATGLEVSLNDLAEALIRVMGADLRPEYREARKVNPVSRRLASTDLARQQLGFEARISLEEGLRRTVEWWRSARTDLAAA
jgi:UDP-glucose 4-epimerase